MRRARHAQDDFASNTYLARKREETRLRLRLRRFLLATAAKWHAHFDGTSRRRK